MLVVGEYERDCNLWRCGENWYSHKYNPLTAGPSIKPSQIKIQERPTTGKNYSQSHTMIPQLPTELKVSIFKHADKKSLLTVMRANSAFHDIAEPIVYSTVRLTPFVRHEGLADATIVCFHVLVARPTAAAAVRCLILNLHREHNTYLNNGIVGRVFEAVRNALPKLLDLEKLIISHWGAHFPGPDLLPSLPLQSLHHYRGPPELLKDIQSRDLVNLRICSSGPTFEPTYRALLAAACYSGWKLRVLELDGSGDNSSERALELISDIHGLFPNLRYLGLGIWVELTNVSSYSSADPLTLICT